MKLLFGGIRKEVEKVKTDGVVEIYTEQDELLCEIFIKDSKGSGVVFKDGRPDYVFIGGCSSGIIETYWNTFQGRVPSYVMVDDRFDLEFHL